MQAMGEYLKLYIFFYCFNLFSILHKISRQAAASSLAMENNLELDLIGSTARHLNKT